MRSAVVLLLAFAAPAPADDWYAKAVESVEATFEPATAKPGQTVTFKLTVKLKDGYHTYPMVQPDKVAASLGMVNTLKFPTAGDVIFVGQAKDPAKFDTTSEPKSGILELRTMSGTVVYERPAVVSPKAAAGEVSATLKSFVLSVCDERSCFPPKTLKPAAKLTVQAGPAVAVAKEYADEVAKAVADK